MGKPKTRENTIRNTTLNYLNGLSPSNMPSNRQIEEELIDLMEQEFDLQNAVKTKGRKWKILVSLTPKQIAEIIAFKYPVRKIACAGMLNASSEKDILAIYQEQEGIYTASEEIFYGIMEELNYDISTKEYEEIMRILRKKAKRVELCDDKDLIAVNNGIFNYKTKTLMPFDPQYVFLSKSKVNYNPSAANPVIYNPDDGTSWDVESWMQELSDDPEIVNLLWEILGAILRPNVSWDKSAWFYANTGNNGKGTLCELMRNLCGPGTYASIPLSDFGTRFGLEALIGAQAIIVDENDVGFYIESASKLKAVITNDVVSIEGKFQKPIAYRFKGFMVQCINELPRIRDRSNSIYRRQLFVPFEKCFTGHARKYIKNDYLKRPEVLEYVLHRILHMDYYELSEPAACKMLLEDYKEYNDPLLDFVNEIFPKLKWDLIPFTFLYDLYKAWLKKYCPAGKPLNRTPFITNLLNMLPTMPEWKCDDKKKAIRPKNMMDKPEPLILEYDLTDWKNPRYKGEDVNQICRVALKDSYRGLERVVTVTSLGSEDACDDCSRE